MLCHFQSKKDSFILPGNKPKSRPQVTGEHGALALQGFLGLLEWALSTEPCKGPAPCRSGPWTLTAAELQDSRGLAEHPGNSRRLQDPGALPSPTRRSPGGDPQLRRSARPLDQRQREIRPTGKKPSSVAGGRLKTVGLGGDGGGWRRIAGASPSLSGNIGRERWRVA